MSQLTDNNLIKENEYNALFNQATEIINQARFTVAKQLNKTASAMYFEIGKLLVERKIESTHGSGVVNRLSIDLKAKYPQMGVSPRQLWNMKKFYLRYYESNTKLLQVVAVLPWSDNLLLLDKDMDDNAIMFYSRVSSRIRRIRMFIEQWYSHKIYDPIGVEHGNCQFESINILSLRDKLKTEKFKMGAL